ncbi:hypothetical protein sos41_07060 [Alphaproteobacteria bacterium SO-S41]|nr:hypothetical protein sos41_07060 [Alphaproteobacteria bacterium SO-S41]
MSPMFPAGVAGAGLLLFRLSVAGSVLLLSQSAFAFSAWWQIPGLAAAAALSIGMWSRAAALGSIPIVLHALARDTGSLGPVLVHIVSAVALALTGAGAFSVDAHFFGRRRVNLPGANDTSG